MDLVSSFSFPPSPKPNFRPPLLVTHPTKALFGQIINLCPILMAICTYGACPCSESYFFFPFVIFYPSLSCNALFFFFFQRRILPPHRVPYLMQVRQASLKVLSNFQPLSLRSSIATCVTFSEKRPVGAFSFAIKFSHFPSRSFLLGTVAKAVSHLI